MSTNRTAWVVCGAAAVGLLGGCAVSRHDQVKAKSIRVERELVLERDKVLAGTGGVGDRDGRLGHLSTLKLTLSAANIALGTVPYAVPPEKRPAAYDVLDEVYGTIEWNIPLGPRDALRPMPKQFQGNTLRLD